MISHKAVTILWWVVPFRWLIWFCTIFASVIGAFEVAENILSLAMPFNNGQQIPIAFLSSGIGVIFLTNEKILNVHKNMKSIDLLSQRLSELEASMTPQDIEELERIEEETEKIIQYGVDIDPWYEIKLGEIARLAGLNEDAMKHYHRAREQFVENGDEKGVAKALNNMGNVEKTFGNMNKSTRLHKESLSIRERIGDKEGVAASLNNLGINARQLGDFDQAENLYKQSLEIEQELNRETGISKSYNNLGNIYSLKDEDSQRARSMHQKSLEIDRKNENFHGIVTSLNNLAGIELRDDHINQAEELASSALELSEEIDYPAGVSLSLLNLGKVYRKQERFIESQSCFQKMHEIGESMGSARGMAYAMGELGKVFEKIGNYKEAKRHYMQSLGIFRDTGNKLGEADILANLSELAFLTGKESEGEMYKRMSEEINSIMGLRDEEE